MPRSMQILFDETCDMRLRSVGLVCTAICSCIRPAMVDVALIGPRLSMMVRVPQAMHAWIASPSAAPYIAHGYAAVWSALFDAELCTTHALLCSAPSAAAPEIAVLQSGLH